MSEVKVAFVGCGGNANGHMNRVHANPDADIIAVCDLDESRAREAADKFGAKAYTDQEKMIDSEDMAALYVSVPPFAHTTAEILAAQKGVHLLVEKPVTLNGEQGLEIWEAIDQADVISCVGYQVRYASSVDLAKQFLEGKTIGMVSCARWGGLPPQPWWRVMGKSGGQLVEQTTHQVDLIRYLAGDFAEVQACYGLRMLDHVEGLDIPDVMAVSFRLMCGAVGAITSSCAMINGGGKSEFEIMTDSTVMKWSSKGVTASPGEHPELDVELPDAPSIDDVFIDAVKTGDGSNIRSDYLDGLKSAAVTLAMNKSAETGEPVTPYIGP